MQISKPVKTQTHEGCTAKCDRSPNCVSWTWNKKKKKCYLIRESDLTERTQWISGNCRDPNDQVTVTNNLFNAKEVELGIQCAQSATNNIPPDGVVPHETCGTVDITSDTCDSPNTRNSFKDYNIDSTNTLPNKCQINPQNPFQFTIRITNKFTNNVDILMNCQRQKLNVGSNPPFNKKTYTPCNTIKTITASYNNNGQFKSCVKRGIPLRNLKIITNRNGDNCDIVEDFGK